VTVSGELARYKLNLVGVQDTRWDGRAVALNLQENTHCSVERGTRIMNWVQIFLHKKIIAVKRVDRMPYKILRGHWCDIIFLNVHAPTEDKIDDVKNSFSEELERV
jgi:hypothetical protein